MATNRLLDPNAIPLTLWERDADSLRLPPCLIDAYVAAVEKNNLRELGVKRDDGAGPVGGLSKEQTDLHFAQAFDGSAARVLLAVLDPKDEIGETSNTFLRCTAGNSISLTDAPCGAGAAGLVLLSAVAHLREKGILPREPLHVKLIGAELSIHAREYAQVLLSDMTPALEAQAIFVDADFQEWDVTCDISNTNLVTSCIHASRDVSARLLIVANFNGFLERERKRGLADPQLTELFRYASGPGSFAIWIEPMMNVVLAQGGFFPWLRGKVEAAWRRFARLSGASATVAHTSAARFYLPLEPGKTAAVRLAVLPLELERGA